MKIPKWLNIFLIIISPLFSFLGITLFTMPRGLLTIIIVFGVILISICFININYLNKKKKNNSKKLKNLSKRISKLYDNFEETKRIKEAKEKYEHIKKCNETYDIKIKDMRDCIKITIIVIAIFYVARCEPIVTFAKEIIFSFYELPTPEPMLEPTNKSENEKGWICFALEFPSGYPYIDDEEYEKNLVLWFYFDEYNLDDIIKSNIQIWLNGRTPNSSLDTAVTSSGNSTDYYTKIEESFSNKEGKTQSSKLLDELIVGRKELLELYPNGTLAWNLANHMQTYALNYSDQTNDEKSILYFYMKSIQYTQKSLEFEMDDKCRYERIRYLQSRYKDIAECESIDKDIRFEASKVYMAIQEELNELGISLQ